MPKKPVTKKEPTLSRDPQGEVDYQELYNHCLDSKMTVRAIAKYLQKSGVKSADAATFCSTVGISVNLSHINKLKAVAVEIWQRQRIHMGKQRWQSPGIPEDLLNMP
jgi:hypothetical protein